MILSIDPFQKISPWKETWSIEVKILTIWEDASIVNENMQKLLHVVLMDKQHDKVQATVENDLITTFIHQLKEGHVFIISDFKVIPNGGLVRVTRHRFRILFKCSTSVVAAANRVIPNPGLSLTSMDEILQKRTDYEYLIDFVGVLCGLKRKTDVECNGKVLKVIVLEVLADGKKIPCNLVGDYSALIDINSLKKYQRPPVLILQSFKIKVNGDKVSLQNVINVSRISINPGMQETVNFLNEYRIASHHFSRLCSNEIGDLVCLIRTIANRKGNNKDGQFFVVGKIKEIVEDPEWWVFSCVCGHPIVGDDNVFHCQLCGREVQHFMTSYRIKILVEDRTSCGMFVLLDSAATKLLGRTCYDVFLLLEDEIEKIEHRYCPQFFHQLIGKEIVFKVQAKRINSPGYCGTFKIVNVISDARFFNKLQPDQCIKCGQLRSYDNQVISGVPIQLHSIKEMLANILCAKIYSSASRNDHICFLIGEIIDVVKHQKWWYYCCLCNAPVCHVGNLFYCYLCRVECVDAIRRYHIKIIVSHSNGSNIFILEDDESNDDYTVPNSMISQLMNKKIVFIVDPRPIGYELNTSLHVVRAICDDIDIVRFLEDSTHDNQQQKFHLDPFVPHFPFEFKNPVEFHSNASIQCSSSSSAPVRQASPISVLNWNCWTINHDFHARISSSQGSNLVGNHQPLTIREELRSAFGQCENTGDAVERMDEKHDDDTNTVLRGRSRQKTSIEVGHLDAQCTQMEKTGIIQERIQKYELDGDKKNWVEDQDFRVTPTPCSEKPRKRTERQVTRWRWKNRDHNTHREDRGRKGTWVFHWEDIISSSLSVFFVKPILIRSLLSHISLLTLSGIRAKIESDQKRKKSPVVPAEQKEKHKPHLNKTKKMSYCGNSDGGDGAESPVRETSLLTLSAIPAKKESDRKRKKSPVVLAEQKEKHKQHLNKTNKM
ncbi:Replication factor-A carboxy-terminal domain protein [Arachis hypogaea]|nr:Replication factor-A carboxy-terminal domain protein [Arachis hypogaea]